MLYAFAWQRFLHVLAHANRIQRKMTGVAMPHDESSSQLRVFVAPAQLVPGEIEITGDEHRYLGFARRSRPGDALDVLDGEGRRAPATIVRIGANATVVLVGTIEFERATPPHVRVLVPLIKGDRMDLCLEKLVEVGADEIVVWPAERSVVKLDPRKRATRLAHLALVSQAAARQSRRTIAPIVSMADSLASAIGALPSGIRVVLDPNAERGSLPREAPDVTIASGPEGGISPAEDETLASASFVRQGLGPRVLRAETAPVVAVALLRAATTS